MDDLVVSIVQDLRELDAGQHTGSRARTQRTNKSRGAEGMLEERLDGRSMQAHARRIGFQLGANLAVGGSRGPDLEIGAVERASSGYFQTGV